MNLICHSDGRHTSSDDLFELGKLGLVVFEETKLGALLRRQAAEGVDLAVGNLLLPQLPLVTFYFCVGHVRQLEQRIAVSPQALHEKLLELNNGLDGLPAEFLDGVALTSDLVYLHGDIDHHVQVENALLQNLAEALFEDRVADVLVFEDVAQDQKQWFHIHVLHISGLHLGEKLIQVLILLQLLEERDLVLALSSDRLELFALGEDQWHVLDEKVLVNASSVHALVLEQHSRFVLGRRVSEVSVEEARDEDEQDEEGEEEDGQVVLGVE